MPPVRHSPEHLETGLYGLHTAEETEVLPGGLLFPKKDYIFLYENTAS